MKTIFRSLAVGFVLEQTVLICMPLFLPVPNI